MASTWTSVKFNHRAPKDAVLLRAFVGGANNEELVSLDDKEMLGVVREELKDIMELKGSYSDEDLSMGKIDASVSCRSPGESGSYRGTNGPPARPLPHGMCL
jgi:hypothetical protein